METDFYLKTKDGKFLSVGEANDMMARGRYVFQREEADTSYSFSAGEIIIQGEREQKAFVMLFPSEGFKVGDEQKAEIEMNHQRLRSKVLCLNDCLDFIPVHEVAKLEEAVA